MIFRILAFGLFLIGLALVGSAGIIYFLFWDAPGVTIDELEHEFAACEVGQEYTIVLRIHNPTRHTVRVVGLGTC